MLFRGRALVLFGRVFRVIWIGADSEKAIAVQTNEVPPNAPPLVEPSMPSFLQVLLGEIAALFGTDRRSQYARWKAITGHGQVCVLFDPH